MPRMRWSNSCYQLTAPVIIGVAPHFSHVHQLTTLLYVTGERGLVNAISWWSGSLGGGLGRLLLGGLRWRWGQGTLRLGGGRRRSVLRLRGVLLWRAGDAGGGGGGPARA